MPEIIWKAPAIADLMAIVDYIADDNPDAALAPLEDIETAVARLADHPGRGRPGRVSGTRELIIRSNYIAVYVETPTTLSVLRVLHAARMWP
ncbi:MAG: type II toxin-antitoxin system RelE/ParE family toxin [Glycocaulis sp.]